MDEFAVVALEELQQRPDGDVLECGITRLKESEKVAVNAPRRCGPVLDERVIVANCSLSEVYNPPFDKKNTIPLLERLPRAAALFP